MKIAIIGSGISGLGSLYHLSKKHITISSFSPNKVTVPDSPENYYIYQNNKKTGEGIFPDFLLHFH